MFFPILNEFGETGALGGLGKVLEVELDIVCSDIVVSREPYLCEFILILDGGCAICMDAFAPFWCTLTL